RGVRGVVGCGQVGRPRRPFPSRPWGCAPDLLSALAGLVLKRRTGWDAGLVLKRRTGRDEGLVHKRRTGRDAGLVHKRRTGRDAGLVLKRRTG
ncbi:hypothetical protein, partial [Streptomyces sp. PAL114]|uniref:hypothetical protein n=1 Tax=Streptomyces sp. PAL114 TaxID=2970893 RepID=UPI0028FD0ECD